MLVAGNWIIHSEPTGSDQPPIRVHGSLGGGSGKGSQTPFELVAGNCIIHPEPTRSGPDPIRVNESLGKGDGVNGIC